MNQSVNAGKVYSMYMYMYMNNNMMMIVIGMPAITQLPSLTLRKSWLATAGASLTAYTRPLLFNNSCMATRATFSLFWHWRLQHLLLAVSILLSSSFLSHSWLSTLILDDLYYPLVPGDSNRLNSSSSQQHLLSNFCVCRDSQDKFF